jgi:hypothetical protein
MQTLILDTSPCSFKTMHENSNLENSSQNRWMYVQIAWFILVTGIWIGMLLHSRLDPDYTSGELLDHSLAWSETGHLYTSLNQPPYRVLNYPPLFLLAVRELSQTGINPLLAGRLLNFIAFLGIVTVLFRWLRKEGCGRKETCFLISLLGSSFPLLYSVGQFHLELFAIGFSLLGLYLVRKPGRWIEVILGGIFCGLACFVKQTQIVSALIAVAWLWRYHLRRVFPFFIGLFLTGLVGSALLYLNFGLEAWRHLIIYTVGTFSLAQLFKQLTPHLLPWIIFTGIAIGIGWKEKEKRKDLLWWYFVGSTLWLLSSGRLGAGSQYFIEWSFATLLWIGPWLVSYPLVKPALSKVEGGGPKEIFFKLILLFQIIAADIGVAGVLFYNLRNLRETVSVLPNLCAELPPPPTLIVTEEPGFARACGHEPALHPFIMANLATRGLWNETPFIEQLSSHQYPVLILPFDPQEKVSGVHAERWTPRMIKAMAEHYRVVRSHGKWKILEPS